MSPMRAPWPCTDAAAIMKTFVDFLSNEVHSMLTHSRNSAVVMTGIDFVSMHQGDGGLFLKLPLGFSSHQTPGGYTARDRHQTTVSE